MGEEGAQWPPAAPSAGARSPDEGRPGRWAVQSPVPSPLPLPPSKAVSLSSQLLSPHAVPGARHLCRLHFARSPSLSHWQPLLEPPWPISFGQQMKGRSRFPVLLPGLLPQVSSHSLAKRRLVFSPK